MKIAEYYTQKSEKPTVEGSWFKIQWTPNFSADERLNIGVAFKKDDGKFDFKLLEQTAKLECLYGKSINKTYKFIRQYLGEAQSLEESPLENVIFSDKYYASGNDISEILTDLYNDVVTLATPATKTQTKDIYSGYETESFVNYIKQAAQHKMDVFIYNEYFQKSDNFMDGERSTHLQVPINGKKLGAISSTDYSTAKTAKVNLTNSLLDLSIASQIKDNLKKQKTLFVLLPSDSLKETNAKEFNNIYNLIDVFLWKSNKGNIAMKSDQNPDRIFQMILEYCD